MSTAYKKAMDEIRRSPEQLSCTRSFAMMMAGWARDAWSDVNVWNAMEAYRQQMEVENEELARQMSDRQAGEYGYPPRPRQDTTPPWER